MLFRAVIKEHGDFRCLQTIITTLSKNSKECSMIIGAKEISFVIRDDSRRCLPLIWSEIKSDSCFSEYTFRGVSEENNQIVLLLNPSFLARALGPVRSFELIKFKLVKIQENSYLSVILVVISSISMEKKNIAHNIPVKVLLPRKWEHHCLPELPEFNTIIELPNVRHIIDKYKNLSPTTTIYVEVSERRLTFTIETDMTTLMSNFHNLHAEHNSNTPREMDDTLPNREIACQVETKSLALFMSSTPHPVMEKALLILENHCVKLRVTVKEGVVLYGIAPHVDQ